MPFTPRFSLPRRLYNRWLSRPWLDWLVAGALIAAALLAIQRGWMNDPLHRLGGDQRSALYQTLAGIAGAFLGFGITPIAILLALAPGPRLRALFGRFGRDLVRTFMAAVRADAAATVILALAVAADTDRRANGLWRTVTAFVVVFTGLRVARLLVLFSRLLMANARDLQGQQSTQDRPASRDQPPRSLFGLPDRAHPAEARTVHPDIGKPVRLALISRRCVWRLLS